MSDTDSQVPLPDLNAPDMASAAGDIGYSEAEVKKYSCRSLSSCPAALESAG